MFYAEAEDILTHLPKLGIPMTCAGSRKMSARGMPKYSPLGKLVQQLRKKIDDESDPTPAGGSMTALEEAELADGQGHVLVGHGLRRPIAAAPKKRCGGRWR
jgi:hypothetical protein